MIIIQNQTSSPKKKVISKKKSFIIVNDDNTGGYLVKSVINTMVSSGMVEQDARFGGRRSNNIKLFDAIVVGDCNSVFNYDFRVVKGKDLDSLDELDGREFKVYGVVDNYNEILSRLNAYVKLNYPQPKKRSFLCCKAAKVEQPAQIHLNIKFEEQPKPVFLAKEVCKFRRVDPIKTTEKVTFFADWVKIGLHQFDIEYDCLGNQYISDSSLNKYYITEDRYGRRFLVTR